MISRTHSGIFDQFVDLDERGLMKQLRISKNDLLQQLKFIEANGIAEFNWKTELPQVTFLHERLPDDYLTIAANVLKSGGNAVDAGIEKVQPDVNALVTVVPNNLLPDRLQLVG